MLIVGNDHAGTPLKNELLQWLEENKVPVDNVGTDATDSVDYPDFAKKVCEGIKGNDQVGLLICGSGNGIAMTANKFPHVRAALCWNREISELARLHNNANVLVLPGRFISTEEAVACLKMFLETKFEGGRHQGRLDKMCI